MPGYGALGQFPLGGGPFGTATVATIGWFSPISEPVRFKRTPRAAVAVNNQTLAFNPLPIVSFGYFAGLSEPVRKKPGTRAERQQVLAFQPTPVVSFGWFEELSKPRKLAKPTFHPHGQQWLAFEPLPRVSFGWFENLSEPKRFKKGLRTDLQQFFTSDTDVIPISKLIQWFANLSEPVRIKPGLKASLQQFLASPSRLIPTPTSFGILDAIETTDTFLAGAMLWNRATDAEIGVINTTPQPAEIAVYPSAPVAGVITVRISIVIG